MGGCAIFGACLVGADVAEEGGAVSVTWDCWKLLVHDRTQAPSKGRMLSDLVADERVAGYDIVNGGRQLLLHNIWGETFVAEQAPLPAGLEVHVPNARAI